MEIDVHRFSSLTHNFKCSINRYLWLELVLLFLIGPFCSSSADTCPSDTFELFKVGNLSQCYWTFKTVNQGCVGYSTSQTCDITMGFCRSLQDIGCGTGSSVCVKTVNGTGNNKTISHNVGIFQPNTNPYHIIPSSRDQNFIAQFNGSQFTRKDGSNCTMSTEIHFNCKYDLSWPSETGGSVPVPSKALQNVTFNQTTCKFTVTVLYDGACPSLLPPSPTLGPHDTSPSLGSVLIIIFVAVVSTYFLFGITFKYCYGFRGREVLPHSDFWVDLPALIVDGMVFTVRCGKTDMARTYDGI